ncbi:MAG: ABC transporter permease [Candidimonas sp.]|nr:MAG: ABC transporter permease [Candidimonas sp.]
MGRHVLSAYVLLLSLLVAAPIIVVVVMAFSAQAYFTFPPTGFSGQWFAQVAADPEWMASLRLSIVIALLVATFSTLLGVPAALGLRRAQGAWSAALQLFLLSPLMLPTMLIGLALLEFLQMLNLPTSLWAVVLGHTVIACPYVVRLVLASFAGVDPSLSRAARNLGASPIQAFRRVTFPLIRHGVIAGALFSLIVSLDDVNIAIFLSDVHVSPLPVRLFTYIEQNADPLGAAVASVLVLLAALLIIVCDRVVGIEWLFGVKQQRRA